jgi:hypothetical protein
MMASAISTVFVNIFVFLSVWIGMNMLTNRIYIGQEECIVWIFLLAIAAESIAEFLIKNEKVILPRKRVGAEIMTNKKLRVNRRQKKYTSVCAIFAILAIDAYSKFSIEAKPFEINNQFMASIGKTGYVMATSGSKLFDISLDNLIYEPLRVESIPIRFQRMCLPRQTFLEADIFEDEYQKKIEVDQDANFYIEKNTDATNMSISFSHEFELQEDRYRNVTTQESSFNPSRLRLERADLIKNFKRLYLISIGILLAAELIERIPLLHEIEWNANVLLQLNFNFHN